MHHQLGEYSTSAQHDHDRDDYEDVVVVGPAADSASTVQRLQLLKLNLYQKVVSCTSRERAVVISLSLAVVLSFVGMQS